MSEELMINEEVNPVLEARKQVIKAGLTLVEKGLIARTWGNISARISEDAFVITPSGRSYESLTPEDIVIVNLKNLSYEGDIKPSGEVATHAEVYRNKPEVNFVIHTHQLYATSLSIMGEDIEGYPVAKYAICCSDALARNVKNTIKKNPEAEGLFLRNHGVVCMGRDCDHAFEISEKIEEICKDKYLKICQGFINEADGNVDVNYGESYRENGRVYLSVNGKKIDWPVGYAAMAKKDDVPKNLRGLACLHDTFYLREDVNFVSHVTAPNIVTISKLKSGRLKRGFKSYIDDQCQIIGPIIKSIKIRLRKSKLKNRKQIEKAMSTRNAILVKSGGAICIGKTYDDIEAETLVLDKGCMAAILVAINPKIKPIRRKIAAHMRSNYVDSYSKLKDYVPPCTPYAMDNSDNPNQTQPDQDQI